MFDLSIGELLHTGLFEWRRPGVQHQLGFRASVHDDT